ncbi:bifunctional Transport protein particle (TRAPP) component/NO signaling-Golgi transport ligand-binding domain superfamily/TRAPP I complex [Babesia duncani]|uniref:Bifunctional Transport protein particle (TRAPP) component/NO signaling-Golgi transport ligand-binding domain superfamily/TRAPP I complex n=1 Tax=Babesia duncani TaxID=323732 RepID=A0AAD9PIH5_9APIC|nr:bifunctional Transport protein particle (TRAPP) component/NO signaling-Golgi transport ligand-binding domain superfamily/TRAPP I complex [Babesia duncani]
MKCRLHQLGINIGYRILELLTVRDKITKRHCNILSILYFISNNVWKYLFNHTATLLRGNSEQPQCGELFA